MSNHQENKSFPKLSTSCLLFDSPKFEKILLIERENEPERGLWSFPGGKLRPGESVKDCMEREVFEETGYKVSVVKDALFSVTELKDSNYLIISGMAFLKDLASQTDGRPEKDKSIVCKYFSLDEKDKDSIWKIENDKCIDCLKDVIKRFVSVYKKDGEACTFDV